MGACLRVFAAGLPLSQVTTPGFRGGIKAPAFRVWRAGV